MQVMLSKYAHLSLADTDALSMFELESISNILYEHNEALKKEIQEQQDVPKGHRVVNVSDLTPDMLD